jgi:adenylate kinase family enzyme
LYLQYPKSNYVHFLYLQYPKYIYVDFLYLQYPKSVYLAEFIPKDIVLLKETNHFTYVEVREAFNEITTSMINRAAAAKIQRLRNTQSAIKRAARSMAEQVDQVQKHM